VKLGLTTSADTEYAYMQCVDPEEPVSSCTTREIPGFKVNPLTGKLERTVAIDYFQSQEAPSARE